MDYLKAFLIGGLICAIVQILMDKTKLMPGRIMVLLVCTGAILGAIGIYEPFIEFAGSGASIPLLGFGNTLWSKRGHTTRGNFGDIQRRFYRECSRYIGRTYFWIFSFMDI